MNVQRGKPEKRMPALAQGQPLIPDVDAFTVIILGVPRGGTTMVAGVAKRCGLSIGDNLPGNLEDPDFSQTAGHDVAQMEAAAARRNAVMKVWGWKYPRAASYLPALLPKLRNPRIVMVWRDLMATAARNVARGKPIRESLRAASRIQAKNIELVEADPCPILHVSYEKAVRDPAAFVHILADFIGSKPPADMEEVCAFMEPGSYKPIGPDVVASIEQRGAN